MRRAGALVVATAAAFALGFPAAHAAPLPSTYDADLQRVRAWYGSGQIDSASVLAGRLVENARRQSDPGALATLLRIQGQLFAAFGRPQPAEPILREAVALSEGVPDSVTLSQALMWLAVSYEGQGFQRRAADTWGRLFDVATAVRDTIGIGSALSAFAYDSLRAGRYEGARTRYQEAIRLLAASGALAYELNARLGLARALEQLGRYDEDRACLVDVAQRAGATGLTYNEANAWNNLGALEYGIGDPGTAVECYRKALALHSADGSVLPELTTMTNIAIAETALGRFASAESLLTSAIDRSRAGGLPTPEARARTQLGDLAAARGRWKTALTQCEAGLALSDRLEPNDVVELAIGRARARMELGQSHAAAEELDTFCVPLRPALTRERQLTLEQLRAEMRLRDGRPGAALDILTGPIRGLGEDLPRLALPLIVLAARAERTVDHAEAAAAYGAQALEIWESDRSVPLDPQWRAQRAASGRAVFEELLAERLARAAADRDANAGAAFDLLQRFKARTLREQMRGPARALSAGSGAPSIPTVAEVQAVLGPGEALLDLFVGAEESFAFTVTRESCRVAVLPGDAELTSRVRLLVDYVATAPSGARDPQVVREAGRAVGTLLLAGCVAAGGPPSRLLVSPDGVLHRLPIALLRFPEGGAVLDHCDVAMVPSASILVDLRHRSIVEPERAGRGGMVMVEGPVAEGGARLPGVEREVRDLSREYSNVTRLVGAEARDPRRWTEGLPGILHVAAHSVVDDERPWRAGVRLGVASEGEDPYLRADTLLGTDWPSRLVVLSSCESAGGRSGTGEGVEGLAVAFLTGGVEAAVATLWPVDDQAAAEFNRHLYDALARGAAVSAALSSAQRAMRAGPRWSDPFFWAGYVVIGNGDVQLPLRSRPFFLRKQGLLGAALALAVAVMFLRRRIFV